MALPALLFATLLPGREALALSQSKLSVQAGPNVGSMTTSFVSNGQPQIIKLVDAFGDAGAIKTTVGSVKIIGRIQLQAQPQDGDPVARAQDWWNSNKATITGSDGQYIDFWEGYDAPNVSTLAQCKWVNDFEVARQKILANHSLHAVIGSFGNGSPSIAGQMYLSAFLPAFQAAVKLGNWLGLHEYSAPFLAAGFDNTTKVGNFTGRYRAIYKNFLKVRGLGSLPLVINELGIDGAVVGDVQQGWMEYASFSGYAQQLQWYDNLLREDAYVKGACIFLIDGTAAYDTFAINQQLSGALTKYMNSCCNETKTAHPPPVRP